MAQAARINLALAPTLEATHALLSGDAHITTLNNGGLCVALEHVFAVACRR